VHWFLILWIAGAGTCGGMDCGINPMYVPPPSVMHRIEMPDEATCLGILNLNKSQHVECWATPEQPKE
jgi:hypothetical protein